MVELRKKIRDFYKKANKKERTIDGVEFECATACAVISSDEDSTIVAVSDAGSSAILKIAIKKNHLRLSASVLQSYSTEAKIPVSLLRHGDCLIFFRRLSYWWNHRNEP